MSADLLARFTRRFAGGAAVEADLRRPADRFSVTVLFGPSGCGKTMTLRCLAGLERPERGRITFGAATWFDAGRRVFLTPQQRDIGYLFQEYALFPHLTLAGNIGYGLRGMSRTEWWRRVADMLGLFGLAGLQDRYPHQVSGGEQQRVALARVLVRRPRLLLLDEPLSALDGPTREQLRPELRRLLAGFGVPAILVTHDRVEALALADHLVVLDRGRVRQQGPARDVFAWPADLAVARTVGMETVQPGRVVQVADGMATVAVGQARLSAAAAANEGAEVHVCIRGEAVALDAGPVAGGGNRLEGVVRSVLPEGPLVRVGLDCGFPLVALWPRAACDEADLREGVKVTARVKEQAVHLIPRGGRLEDANGR
jgi:molybdate transport system ATP-binding protein